MDNKEEMELVFKQGLIFSLKYEDNEKAISTFTDALKIDPNSSPAYLNRGSCYFKSGDYDKAIKDYEKALSINPNDINVYKILDWALYVKNWAMAYENHIEVHKLTNNAIILAEEHKYKESSERFDDIINICSNNAFVFYQYGLLCATVGDINKAINEFTEAIKLAPKIAAIYYDRGKMFQRGNMNDFAIDDFTKAIELYPQFVGAYCNRGVSYFQQGEKELAIIDFESALKIDPTDEYSLKNLIIAKK